MNESDLDIACSNKGNPFWMLVRLRLLVHSKEWLTGTCLKRGM